MKSIWREILLSVIMAVILPGILQNWKGEAAQKQDSGDVGSTVPGQSADRIRLSMKLRNADGSVEEMDLDDYLVGVVLAEMPSTFEPEAKKAQAVAARTFARKAAVTGGKHGDGSVCAESGCCQAWLSHEEYRNMGGSEKAIAEAESAVTETSGLVLTYEGVLIEATYFSCSGGRTEDAAAVWGTDVPYLQAVASPGEEHAVHHRDEVYFTRDALETLLNVSLSGDPEEWFRDWRYTSGGGVDTVAIAGKSFSGKELRSLLNLRSTAFTIEAEKDGITVITNGFGHRVGLSQYGADAMAVSGSGFREILAWYYPGTSLEFISEPG